MHQGGDKDAWASKDEKSGPTEKTSGSSSVDTQSGQRRAASAPGTGIATNSFDFSAVAGLLNDPNIKELAEQIAQDPSFNQMAEQLKKTFEGSGVGDGIPQVDPQQYFSSVQQVMQNPKFMTMAERLGSALLQDPSVSLVLENLGNPAQKDQTKERMSRVKEDPTLKPIFDEIETGGPAAMIRYWNDPSVLQKLGEAMGLPVSGDAVASAETSGQDETDEVGNEGESIVHNTASVGDVEGGDKDAWASKDEKSGPTERLEARLKSLIKEVKVEYGILDKLVYKNKNQHRRSSYFQYLLKVRRDLRLLLQSADLEHILNSSFLVIHGKRPKHKVQLLESLKRRKCDGTHSFLDRLLGTARLLSQITEPIVKGAMEISALIARSFFMGFSLTVMALLARLRVLVQQILLDVVSVCNAVSSLSRKEQSVKLSQDGVEVYRDLYPASMQAVYLECVWKTDKFVLIESISEPVEKNQDVNLIDVYPGASTVQYQCIETLLGDTDEPAKVDLSFTCEQGASDIKGNLLDGSADRTFDSELVGDAREMQYFASVAETCSKRRLSEGAFPKDKPESRNKVAFVSVKMPVQSARDADGPVKDIKSCSGNREDPAFRLIADGNLNESLL